MATITVWRQFGAILCLLVCVVSATGAATAQNKKTKSRSTYQNGDKQGDLQLAAARTNPLQLRQFLKKMPKGGDLHYHLSGGVYAESFLRAAVEDGLCIDTGKLAFAKCSGEKSEEHKTHEITQEKCDMPCRENTIVPAATAYANQALYDQLIDAFSMRSFVPFAGVSGHDHFFDTFAKFGGTKPSHKAEWVDEAASRAAAQNEQYLELMETPDFSVAAKAAKEVTWTDDFATYREELLAHDLRENVKTAVAHLDEIEKRRREIEHCSEANPAPACRVDVRFIYQVLRGMPKEVVFAQTLLGFEAAAADPEHIVGINFVMPEDGYISMQDYGLHMRIVKFLHSMYSSVHITLHAGELAFGLVPPNGLCCHIRQAVEAGAERIGHGVDVMYEDRPHELLRELASKHVMVEVNLTSNDVILGVSGKYHPLPMYRQFGVPTALSTDDEAVSRIDLTNEYARAVETYNLKYTDLKKMARTSLEHAFLPGQSLWAKADEFSKANPACGVDALGSEKRSEGCRKFLESSEKAQQQWELERRFREFEASF